MDIGEVNMSGFSYVIELAAKEYDALAYIVSCWEIGHCPTRAEVIEETDCDHVDIDNVLIELGLRER